MKAELATDGTGVIDGRRWQFLTQRVEPRVAFSVDSPLRPQVFDKFGFGFVFVDAHDAFAVGVIAFVDEWEVLDKGADAINVHMSRCYIIFRRGANKSCLRGVNRVECDYAQVPTMQQN